MLEMGENNPENRFVQGCLWPNQYAVTGSIYIYCLERIHTMAVRQNVCVLLRPRKSYGNKYLKLLRLIIPKGCI